MLKGVKTLIHSNIYISIGAVLLTIQTQIQIGLAPSWHPYLFLIFFATLVEYNIHSMLTIMINKKSLDLPKNDWLKNNLTLFYIIMVLAFLGFIFALFEAELKVLYALAPIAIITFFYSLPFANQKFYLFKLREIPYLKIFLIAFIWSIATVLLPIIQANQSISFQTTSLLLFERFLFVFAITIPFDIRDMVADKEAGLKTIPTLVSENKAFNLAHFSIIFYLIMLLVNHGINTNWFIVFPLLIAGIITLGCLYFTSIRKFAYYHYGVLDGTMILQGLLVLIFYSFT